MSMCACSFKGVEHFAQTEHNFADLKPDTESAKPVRKWQTDDSIPEPMAYPSEDVLRCCVATT